MQNKLQVITDLHKIRTETDEIISHPDHRQGGMFHLRHGGINSGHRERKTDNRKDYHESTKYRRTRKRDNKDRKGLTEVRNQVPTKRKYSRNRGSYLPNKQTKKGRSSTSPLRRQIYVEIIFRV